MMICMLTVNDDDYNHIDCDRSLMVHPSAPLWVMILMIIIRNSWSKSSHRFGSDVVDKTKKTTQKCVVLRFVSLSIWMWMKVLLLKSDSLMCGSHGLSARRAWRTLSSRPEGPKGGPKGRKLEVGPRRGPRLLVSLYSSIFLHILLYNSKYPNS